MLPQTLTDGIVALLARQGSAPGKVDLQPCTTGGNNRVFIVSADDSRVVAKYYYAGPADTRDRLMAEWSFLGYVTRLGLKCVPRPISCDRVARIALYEYVDGRKLAPGAIGPQEIAAAADFFTRLNGRRHIWLADALPPASEAYFSIGEHFAMLDRRLQRLSEVRPRLGIDAEALDLVGRLRARWSEVKVRLAGQAAALSLPLDLPLGQEDRCISPSDFGFHNALALPDGSLCFIDFEYAGWDDPAKMAADFFCQPAVPVDLQYFEWFLDATIGSYARETERLKARARLLLPVYRIKWCCIMLNDFVPESAQRRRFADPETDELKRRRAQLKKAESAFEAIEVENRRAWHT